MEKKHYVPLRVDFAGGWLDVPKFSIEGEYVVNCAISPLVSLEDWQYHKNSGLGGSGAWALLNDKDGIKAELDLGVGWQDPAVIKETGCCVWKSGKLPLLEYKNSGEFLEGRMALYWTGSPHNTPGLVDLDRNYPKIANSARIAKEGVMRRSVFQIANAVSSTYHTQLAEGMEPLPMIGKSIGYKYCGGGHGGYALYLFDHHTERHEALKTTENLIAIEPYCKNLIGKMRKIF